MEKLTEISIKSKYISVLPDGKLLREVSYGGSQEWVRPRDDKGKKLELGRWQKLKKPNVIADCGCGLVASEDVLTYLEKKEMPAGRANGCGFSRFPSATLWRSFRYTHGA